MTAKSISFHPTRSLRACLLLPLLCAASALRAQESSTPPISTERPSAGVSGDVVPAGSLQSETGVGLLLQKSRYTVDLPENLLRIGFSHRLEFRFASSNLTFQHNSTDGYSPLETTDTGASVKVLLAANNSFAPRSTILGLGFPTGAADLTSGTYDPALTLVWNQAIGTRLNITEVAQVTLTTLDHARKAVWAPGISAGCALSARLSTFAEYAPARFADNTFGHTIDGGFLYAPSPTRQFDTRFGISTDTSGIHTLVSFGYSRRFDRVFSLARLSHR